jgi:hypothetical protein
MLAYHVEWHMRQKLKPLLFDDECLDEVQMARISPVTKAQRSEQAKQKDRTQLTEEGLPVHSFRTLLKDLATLAYNVVHTPANFKHPFITTTRPTPIQFAKKFVRSIGYVLTSAVPLSKTPLFHRQQNKKIVL